MPSLPSSPSRRGRSRGLDADDARSRRNENKIELRKAKKDETLAKRRFAQPADAAAEEPTDPAAAAADAVANACSAAAEVPRLASIVHEYVRGGCCGDAAAALSTVTRLRKLLSLSGGPPIDECISAGLVPVFIHLLGGAGAVVFEAAWCLTNIVSGTTDHAKAVVDAGAIPPLLNLVQTSPSVETREQAVWCLSNVAGDCASLRDMLLCCGALPSVLSMIEEMATTSQMGPLRNATWCLSNLVRNKPAPALEHVERALPTLAKLLSLDDSELMMDTMWALSHVAEAGGDAADGVVSVGCLPRLVHHLEHAPPSVQVPALRALANLLTGSDGATGAVLEAGFLRVVGKFLCSERSRTRKEACWALSNIAAGTAAQIDQLMATPLLPEVIGLMGRDEFEVKKECLWTVANICHAYSSHPGPHTAYRVGALVQAGLLEPLVRMLDANDPKVIELAVDACGHLLGAGEELARGKGSNPFVTQFDTVGGVDKLEELQTHPNETVYNKTVKILDDFFVAEEAEDENLMPHQSGGGFLFGAAAAETPATPFVF